MPVTNESLVLRIQSGEKDLIYELWSNNQPLIKQTVKRFECPEYPEEIDERGNKSRNPDLMQESYLCLVECLPDYDQDKGRFISFYLQRLKWHLIRVISTSKGVSVPVGFVTMQNRYNRYRDTYYLEHGYYPDDDTVMDALKMSYKALETVKGINLSVTSLNMAVGGSDDDIELWETIEGGSAAEIDDCVTALYNKELVKVWESIKRILTDREYFVLQQRYINGSSLSNISQQYNISPERVRTIIDNALVKIRQNGICMKELQLLEGEGAEHGYYVGGVGAFKNNLFTSSTEKKAVQNVARYQRRKRKRQRSEDISQIEQELISFFGDVV